MLQSAAAHSARIVRRVFKRSRRQKTHLSYKYDTDKAVTFEAIGEKKSRIQTYAIDVVAVLVRYVSISSLSFDALHVLTT